MLFGKLNDAALVRFKNTDPTLPASREIASLYNNLAIKEVFRAHDWEQRKKTGQLLLIPNYTTGTATITRYDGTNDADARVVTLSGAALTSSMAGRYFQPQDGSTWYRITYVDTVSGQLYLETPVVDGSSGTFTIWKRFYYLYSEADVILDFKGLDHKGSSIAEDERSAPHTTGTPFEFSAYGVDPFEAAYSTGTIEIAANSNVVTGTNTVWLGNVGPGDILRVNTKVFRVKRVETNTRIILYNYAPQAIAAASSYSIEKDNPLGFEFYFNSSNYAVMQYTYLARGYDLVNEDLDALPLPDEFVPAILSRAEALKRKDDREQDWTAVLGIYQGELEGLKAKRSVVRSRYMQFAPKIHPNMPGRY